MTVTEAPSRNTSTQLATAASIPPTHALDSDHTPVVAEFSFRASKAPADTVEADPFLPPWPDCIA